MYANVKPKAIVFVDYEHWYYSMLNNFHIRPNIRSWRDKLAQKFNITDIYFFADLSNDNIANELPRMREVSNTIIETRNTNGHLRKDYTDFIMLDVIYQKAFTTTDVENFIIFTGDGHFSSVVSFLRNQCDKTVGVYGIKRSCSAQLKDFASWWEELPDEAELLAEVCQAIIDNFRYIAQQREGRGRVIRPTFWKTVENVANHYGYEQGFVSDAMRYLLEQEYIFQVDEMVSLHDSIRMLKVNWEKVNAEDCFMAV